jgi:hypothetical protein
MRKTCLIAMALAMTLTATSARPNAMFAGVGDVQLADTIALGAVVIKRCKDTIPMPRATVGVLFMMQELRSRLGRSGADDLVAPLVEQYEMLTFPLTNCKDTGAPL